jgi:hypothetical protein
VQTWTSTSAASKAQADEPAGSLNVPLAVAAFVMLTAKAPDATLKVRLGWSVRLAAVGPSLSSLKEPGPGELVAVVGDRE